MFNFDLAQLVLTDDDRRGAVRSRTESLDDETSYFVKYQPAEGHPEQPYGGWYVERALSPFDGCLDDGAPA